MYMSYTPLEGKGADSGFLTESAKVLLPSGPEEVRNENANCKPVPRAGTGPESPRAFRSSCRPGLGFTCLRQ